VAEKKGPKGIFKPPLEPSHWILLGIPFHGKLLKVMGKVDGFTELNEGHDARAQLPGANSEKPPGLLNRAVRLPQFNLQIAGIAYRLPDGLKLRDAVLYLEDLHIGGIWIPFNIRIWVLLATLELPARCATLDSDTHLVVALNLPGGSNTTLFREDHNPFAVSTVMFDERNFVYVAPERLI